MKFRELAESLAEPKSFDELEAERLIESVNLKPRIAVGTRVLLADDAGQFTDPATVTKVDDDGGWVFVKRADGTSAGPLDAGSFVIDEEQL